MPVVVVMVMVMVTVTVTVMLLVMVMAVSFPSFLLLFPLFGAPTEIVLGNYVYKRADEDVVALQERLECLDHGAHCGPLLRPAAQALVRQCSHLPGAFLGVLPLQPRVHYTSQFQGIVQHGPCPFSKILLALRPGVVHAFPPSQKLQQYNSEAIYIAHCC